MKTEDIEIPRGALKVVNADYIIYKKDYLFANLEMEIELLRNSKKFRESNNIKRVSADEVKKWIKETH